MINGVKFDNLHSYEDLGLILTSKTIGMPTPKTATIQVPGADGELDYTEYFGDVKYSNRALEFEFSTIEAPADFLKIYSRLHNTLNGRKVKITLDDDPGFYYTGRVFINEWKSNGRIGKVVIEANAEPYKLKDTRTLVSQIISAATTINCRNSRKQVIPTITTNAEITVTFGNYTVVFGPGTRTDEEIIFVQGQNLLTIAPKTGTATVSIEYQEGEL